ncbi:MAG: DUF4383 domain-containing protein [Blastocatellia bacterium]|nr:DUF4383 domain-containing protein [Blastocatellia bacterium]
MAKTASTILGVVFIAVGGVGFVAPGLMGSHLSLSHNIVHLLSGAVALYFGLKGSLSGARMFSLAFGAVYGLLGAAGFLLGSSGTPSAGMPLHETVDANLFTVIPGILELGMMDHIIHIALGVIFLLAGFMTKVAAAQSET